MPVASLELAQIDPLWRESVQEIHQLHDKILTNVRATIEDGIRIGEILTLVRGALKHGQWLPWLEVHAPFSQPMAWYYMTAYDRKDEILPKLLTGNNFSYKLLLEDKNGNHPGSGRQQLHEPNFYSRAVGFRDHLISLFNHHLQRRPLRQWYTEEIYDFWRSLNGVIEVRQQLELELNTRDDVPSGYRS